MQTLYIRHTLHKPPLSDADWNELLDRKHASSFIILFVLSLDATTRAFCLYTPNSQIYPAPQVIPFTKTAYQTGGGIHPNGYYICPESGVYHFTYCLYSGAMRYPYPRRSSAELRLGGASIGDALSYNRGSRYIIVNTCKTIINECRKGNSVYVRSTYDSNTIRQWYTRTSFCGFCITC